MGALKDLHNLLVSMQPVLLPGVFVFCTQAIGKALPDCQPLALFQETEGTTLILRQDEAERLGLDYTYPSRCLTLTVHSDLEAVGLLAAVTGCLAQAQISCNVISAYYHDHLFVSIQAADQALSLLEGLRKEASKKS